MSATERDPRFAELDALIAAGWGFVPQTKISAELLKEILAGKQAKPPRGYRDPDVSAPLESPEQRARRKELRQERKRKAEAMRNIPDSARMVEARRRFAEK